MDYPNWNDLHYNNDDRMDIHVTKQPTVSIPMYKATIIINGKYIVVTRPFPDEAITELMRQAHRHVSEFSEETANA